MDSSSIMELHGNWMKGWERWNDGLKGGGRQKWGKVEINLYIFIAFYGAMKIALKHNSLYKHNTDL